MDPLSEQSIINGIWVIATNINQRPQNLPYLYPAMGSQLRVCRFFPWSKQWLFRYICAMVRTWRLAHMKFCTISCKDPRHILSAFVSVYGNKNLYTPNLSSMADEAITQISMGVLGSPFYICGHDLHPIISNKVIYIICNTTSIWLYCRLLLHS